MKKSLNHKNNKSLVLFIACMGMFWLTAQKVPRQYIAFKAIEALKIDGATNEVSWEKAPWSETFIDIEGIKEPKYKTQMKMLWDDTYLYFMAKMDEPHVWGTLKERDTVIFYNNDFEIFIDPDGDTHNYMEFEMNVLNTIWDLFLTKPYRNHGKVLDSWDIQGIKTAVNVEGTLNNSSDVDKGWSIEVAIPWKVVTEANTHNNIPINEFWRLGFSRVNWEFDLNEGRYSRKRDESGKYLPESNWVWSPQWVINMHEPEKWGYVYFSDKVAGSTDHFEIPNDEYLKWYMYSQFRKLIQSEDKFDEVKSIVQSASEKVLDKSVKIKFEKHSSGWNISALSPFTGKKMIIKDDGKFLTQDN
jgi:cellulose/xylan binding protein with CBM9 domain